MVIFLSPETWWKDIHINRKGYIAALSIGSTICNRKGTLEHGSFMKTLPRHDVTQLYIKSGKKIKLK